MAQSSRERREVMSKGHNRNFGGEQELYLPFGRNVDDNLNQRNEIKELSRQIATLIEKVQYLQPSIQGGDDFEDAQIQFENPFYTLKWSRFDQNNIHDELSEFYASCNHDDFVDWLNTIEEVLQYYDIPKQER